MKQLLLLATLATRIGYEYYITVMFIALGIKANFCRKKKQITIYFNSLINIMLLIL